MNGRLPETVRQIDRAVEIFERSLVEARRLGA